MDGGSQMYRITWFFELCMRPKEAASQATYIRIDLRDLHKILIEHIIQLLVTFRP